MYSPKAFLSKEMMYSCALWSDEEGGFRGDLISDRKVDHLEVAQRRKIRHILQKTRVQPGDRILEFGSGWGGLAIEVSFRRFVYYALYQLMPLQAARSYGCDVDTLTLSIEQKVLAEERVREAGLEGRVSVHLLDYRCIPVEFEKAFDAFVSIEMLEVRPHQRLLHLSTDINFRSMSAPRYHFIIICFIYRTKDLYCFSIIKHTSSSSTMH